MARSIDYGYCMRDLGYDQMRDIWNSKHDQTEFDGAYRTTFGLEPPEPVTFAHQLLIVASALDPASERLEPTPGFEPGTFSLPRKCSAT